MAENKDLNGYSCSDVLEIPFHPAVYKDIL
jgi:hypothetical protein